MKFRPMLGKTIDDPEELRYPLLGSPKLDGIRALVKMNGDLVSRKLKLIPNKYLRRTFGWLRGYDGELVAGDPTKPGCWNRTDSIVMSKEHPDSDTVRFYVFDRHAPSTKNRPYTERAPRNSMRHPRVVLVPQVLIRSPEELERFHRRIAEKGYEGSMYRDPQAGYKYGRSTLNEQALLKYKDWEDCEVKIIGFKEEKENRNALTTNKLGHAKRSSHKANKRPKGVTGAFLVKAINGTFKGKEFPVGMGISDQLAYDSWNNQKSFLGKVGTVRYRVERGADRPWNCRWVGLRNWRDM